MDTPALKEIVGIGITDMDARWEALKPYALELRSRLTQVEWDEFCQTTWGRKRRAIDYRLAGGNPRGKRQPALKPPEPSLIPPQGSALAAVAAAPHTTHIVRITPQPSASSSASVLTETLHVVRHVPTGKYLCKSGGFVGIPVDGIAFINVSSLEEDFGYGEDEAGCSLPDALQAVRRLVRRVRWNNPLMPVEISDLKAVKVEATYQLMPVSTEPPKPSKKNKPLPAPSELPFQLGDRVVATTAGATKAIGTEPGIIARMPDKYQSFYLVQAREGRGKKRLVPAENLRLA